jgi:hypothetical protein
MAQMGLRVGLEGVYRALQRFHLFEPMEAGFTGEQVGRTIPQSLCAGAGNCGRRISPSGRG